MEHARNSSENSHKIMIKISEESLSIRRLRCGSVDNIKMDVKRLATMVMDLRVP
jgi:hypothetical protein